MNVQAPNPFLRFWSLGYRRLVPIVPPGANISPKSALAKRPGSIGKAVGVQRRDGSWSGMDWIPYTASENDLRDWHAMGAGVGLKTGAGIVALDIDTLERTVGDLVQALATQLLGPAPLRWGREPKRLMLYRAPPETPYMRVIFDDGLPTKVGKEPRVELLTDQRQCVVHGIHPDTGRPYRWDGLCPLEELTAVTAEQLRAFFARLSAELPAARIAVDESATDRQHVNQEALRGRPDLVVEAVRRLPNTVDLFPTYDDYIRVGAAIKGALQDDPGLAEECFVEWAGRFEGDDGFDPACAAADLRRVKPPFALGASWLYAQAERHGGASSFVAGTWFDAAAAPFPAEGGGLLFGLDDDPAERPRPAYEFITLDEAAEGALSTATRPLIKGLLDCGALSVLYGESNTGKTFVAMDMAYHVAVGRPWGGMKTTRSTVVYVAAEGGRGARKRAAALKAKYGPCANFHYLLAPVNLLDPQADIGPLIAAIRERFPDAGLIIIDTLSRAMSGGDENSSVDMGRLVSHFDRIRQATAAHVMVVHHSGKDRAKGARGHSLLRAALDTEIEVADGEISVQKQRDLDKSWSSGFTLDTVTLGVDEDGDPITSCTMRLTVKAQVQVGVPTPKERDILEIVVSLIATSPNPAAGVPATEIAACCGGDTTVDTVRTHLRRLAAKGHLTQAERGRWLLRKAGDPVPGASEYTSEISAASIFD